jgi:hypothetical protein
MGGILRLALQSSHATAISCISLDFAAAALAAVEPMELGQSSVTLLLELLKHCLKLLQQVTAAAPKQAIVANLTSLADFQQS